MWTRPPFSYPPDEYESEKASNSYLMSVVALVAGLLVPVVNLAATAFFFIANRREREFVRWHCTQALLSQAAIFAVNVPGMMWTLSIVLDGGEVTNLYLSYVITMVIFNLLEFVATVYSAVQTRKGRHVEWWVFGPMTNALLKRRPGAVS